MKKKYSDLCLHDPCGIWCALRCRSIIVDITTIKSKQSDYYSIITERDVTVSRVLRPDYGLVTIRWLEPSFALVSRRQWRRRIGSGCSTATATESGVYAWVCQKGRKSTAKLNKVFPVWSSSTRRNSKTKTEEEFNNWKKILCEFFKYQGTRTRVYEPQRLVKLWSADVQPPCSRKANTQSPMRWYVVYTSSYYYY